MSLEDELAELSNVYHGQREYIEELEAGMRDCNKKIAALEQLLQDYDAYAVQIVPRYPRDTWHKVRLQDLRQRKQELLPEPPQEPLEGISGI